MTTYLVGIGQGLEEENGTLKRCHDFASVDRFGMLIVVIDKCVYIGLCVCPIEPFTYRWFYICAFEAAPNWEAQAGLGQDILLPQSLKCWDYRSGLPNLSPPDFM